MLAHPSSENDIRARAAVLSEAILATNPHSDGFLKARNEFREELSQIALPVDRMTFFAMERVAVRAGTKAVWMDSPEVFVPHGALVMIDPHFEVPANPRSVVSGLERAGFVIAPASWKPALDGVKLAGLAIDDAGNEPAPAAPSRGRKP